MESHVPEIVDIIIAGGGAAGCVLAARLAEAHPDLEILIVEGGINNKGQPQVINPALFLANLLPGSNTARFYNAQGNKDIAGREIVVATGGCLGGGSSINFMMYLRAQAGDFDDWATKGWGRDDLIPLLKRFEKFHISNETVDKSVHGYDGAFHTSQGGLFHQAGFVDDFLGASSAAGWDKRTDIQDLKTANAFGPFPSWIHPQTGLRQDSAHTLIHPLLEAKTTKLGVLTEHEVIRVIFDPRKRASGIEVLSRQGGIERSFVINARKQVVLSAGALGSPLILERSGIGHQDVVSQLQIPTVFVNPNVGNNYQDHDLILYPYRSSAAPEHTLDGLLSGRLPVSTAISQGSGILHWNGIEAGGKVRPTSDEVTLLGPEFSDIWNQDFKSRPEKPLMIIAVSSGFLGDQSLVAPGQYMMLATISAYPYSRGYIHATRKTVQSVPNFDAGIFHHPADVSIMLWGYKKQREIARRMSHYAGAVETGHPAFPAGSRASFGIDDRSIVGLPREDIKDVVYSKEDDEAILKFLRENVTTSWHSLGTCAMKPLETGGVVDEFLNVYGVQSLKIADLSIVPTMVGANTYSTALLVGEKSAQIILNELKVEAV